MQAGKLLKPVRLALPFSFTTFLLWKLKARCRMKWLWVEIHFTTRLSRYAWRSNTSLIYGMAISLLFIISFLIIQEHCFVNCLLKKNQIFFAHSGHVENICNWSPHYAQLWDAFQKHCFVYFTLIMGTLKGSTGRFFNFSVQSQNFTGGFE